MNDRIESLLRHKPADQLTTAERAEVLEEMSLQEYDLLYRTRTALQSLDADAAPPPRLREALLAQGRKSGAFAPKTRAGWRAVSGAVAVAVAVAVAGAVAVGAWQWIAGQPAREIFVEKVVVQRDTIFRTDTLWITRTEVRYRERAVAARSPVAATDINNLEKQPADRDSSTTGTTIADMPALMEFLGSGDK